MEELIAAIAARNVILFVGAGVSMNLGLPSWNELTRRIGEELGCDPGEIEELGNNFTLAEYYKIKRQSIGSLRSWMDVHWHSSEVDVGRSEIHKLIIELDFPIIYTTNLDRWLERAFEHHGKPYAKIVTVADLSRVSPGETEIVKFHGDFDIDESMVLTESNYYERLEFESPLDIRLRADVLGRSVLFIGYSLTDINIRYLFYKLWKTWSQAGLSHSRPPSYMFMTRPNMVQETVLSNWGINPIVDQTGNPEQGLKTFLASLLDASRKVRPPEEPPAPAKARKASGHGNASVKAKPKPGAKKTSRS